MSNQLFVLGKKLGVFKLCNQYFSAVKLYVATYTPECGTHFEDFKGLSVTEVFVDNSLWSKIHPFACYELSELDGFVFRKAAFCDSSVLIKPFKTFSICVQQNYPF